MDIRPITTDDDYRQTLRDTERLMGAEPDTPEGDRLNALVTVVEVWESQQGADKLA